MGLNRGYQPWRPEVSPFNQDFRDLINEGLEELHVFSLWKDSISRVLVERFPQGQGGAQQFFTARLTADADIVVPRERWLYPGWTEVERAAESEAWVTKANGRNSTDMGPARNMPEIGTGNAGFHGSGYHTDNLPPGFQLIAVPRGTVIHNFHTVTIPQEDEDPIVEVWFDKDNKPDGTCP